MVRSVLPSLPAAPPASSARRVSAKVRSLPDLVGVFHALSDGTRLEILERLRHGEKCVCDLTDQTGAAQSRLSFHLRILREAGLVSDRRSGRWVHYSLVPEALDEALSVLAALRNCCSGAAGGCCR